MSQLYWRKIENHCCTKRFLVLTADRYSGWWNAIDSADTIDEAKTIGLDESQQGFDGCYIMDSQTGETLMLRYGAPESGDEGVE